MPSKVQRVRRSRTKDEWPAPEKCDHAFIPLNAPVPDRLSRFVQYLNNTGGVTADQFDDDWSPIGPMVRKDMTELGLIYEIKKPDAAVLAVGFTPPEEKIGRLYLRPDLQED